MDLVVCCRYVYTFLIEKSAFKPEDVLNECLKVKFKQYKLSSYFKQSLSLSEIIQSLKNVLNNKQHNNLYVLMMEKKIL